MPLYLSVARKVKLTADPSIYVSCTSRQGSHRSLVLHPRVRRMTQPRPLPMQASIERAVQDPESAEIGREAVRLDVDVILSQMRLAEENAGFAYGPLALRQHSNQRSVRRSGTHP